MSVTPDLAGFGDAQHRLRLGFGEDVTFFQQPVRTWPNGTALDPETGEPYDPVLKPTGVQEASGSARVNVAIQDEIDPATQVGRFERRRATLIADLADRAVIDGAVDVGLRGDRWEVLGVRADGIGGEQRFLVHVRRRR